jgi:hypothetical protein
MSHTANITTDERKGTTLVIVCGECSRRTVHEILADVNSDDESVSGDIRVWEHYLIVRCKGCLALSFCRQS